jgi:hypothetical protein
LFISQERENGAIAPAEVLIQQLLRVQAVAVSELDVASFVIREPRYKRTLRCCRIQRIVPAVPTFA